MGDETLVEGFVIRPAKGNDVEDACSIAKTAWARIHDSFRTIMGADAQKRHSQQKLRHVQRFLHRYARLLEGSRSQILEQPM